MARFLIPLNCVDANAAHAPERLTSIPNEATVKSLGCHWLDLVDPSAKDLKEVAKAYGLHASSVKDCLDPEHLPKLERIQNTTFAILRAYDPESMADSDEVQELTRKLAVFVGENFVITIHRRELAFVADLRHQIRIQPHDYSVKTHLLYQIALNVIHSFEAPIDLALEGLENLEVQVFRNPSSTLIEDGYFLKRKAFVFKRMVRLSYDLIPRLALDFDRSNTSHLVQDLKEEGERLFFYCEELLENINNLLSIHISLESHRSGEVMRLLTVLSVVFLPLNFIASIFGMNFENMPELKHPHGYPAVLLLMTIVATGILFWMRGKGWLRRPK